MRVVKPGEDRPVPRGVVGGAEISQATTGAVNIYMGVFRVPAGAAGRPAFAPGRVSRWPLGVDRVSSRDFAIARVKTQS